MVAIFFSNLIKGNRKTATSAPFQSCSQPEKALEGKTQLAVFSNKSPFPYPNKTPRTRRKIATGRGAGVGSRLSVVGWWQLAAGCCCWLLFSQLKAKMT